MPKQAGGTAAPAVAPPDGPPRPGRDLELFLFVFLVVHLWLQNYNVYKSVRSSFVQNFNFISNGLSFCVLNIYQPLHVGCRIATYLLREQQLLCLCGCFLRPFIER